MRARNTYRLCCSLWILSVGVALSISAAENRPNVIIIMADDLGYPDVGFNGCRDILTPHIDRIAREGIRFSDGYVAFPVCSPSRAGLVTGRYPQRFGYENNFGYLTTNPRVGLARDEVTIADRLKSAGYRTAVIGKWHLGAHPVLHPNSRGFDEFFGFLGGGHDYFTSGRDLDEYSREILRDGVPEWLKVADPEILSEWQTPVYRNREEAKLDGYMTTELGREAAAFLKRNRDAPFFLYLSFNAPHTPMQAPAEYLERFVGIDDNLRRLCAALVSAMDDAVGDVLGALDQLGLAENTLVFFLSDNGGSTAHNGSVNAPFRGKKGDLHEGGIRVPFAVRWPAELPAGRVYDHPVISLDIVPTVIAAAGARPAGGNAFDGVDLMPYLQGRKTEAPHQRLYWRFAGRGLYAVRDGNDKIVGTVGAAPELFDLESDPGEQRNVAAEKPGKVEQMVSAFSTWQDGLKEPGWGPKRPTL